MWDRVKKYLIATLAVLVAAALAVGYALRQRAASAGAMLGKAREADAEARGQDVEAKTRLVVIEGELAKTEKLAPPKRTAAQILDEQRRRGQLIK